MRKKLVLTVGNSMMGDDGAGPMLAQMMFRAPLEGWDALDGGSAPEDCTSGIREMAPEEIVIVDSAEMGLEPGDIRLIDHRQIGSLFLVTTHSLPLTYLMEALREFVPSVNLIGIQPEIVAFGCPVSPRVVRAVERVYACFQEGGEYLDAFHRLTEATVLGSMAEEGT